MTTGVVQAADEQSAADGRWDVLSRQAGFAEQGHVNAGRNSSPGSRYDLVLSRAAASRLSAST